VGAGGRSPRDGLGPLASAQPKVPHRGTRNEVPAGGTSATSERDETTPVASPGNSVLLVDDMDDALEMMTYILESAGFRVAAATCVTEALGKLGVESFDALVTDYNLPDGTGSDLIDGATQAGLLDRAHTAVLICTASRYVAPLSSVKVLYKPLSPVDLVEAVEHSIGRVMTDEAPSPGA